MGRPDGGPRPGVTGREAAAPLLFRIADDLPSNGKVFNERERARTSERLKSAEESAPVILFPLPDTEIFVSDFETGSDVIDLLVQADGQDTRVYVDSKPIEKGRHGYRFIPPAPGFYEMKVVDMSGAQSQARFRVLASDDVVHPGL